MRFAREAWLYVIPLVPLLWLLLRWSDARARADLRSLLGEMGGLHVEGDHPRRRPWRRFLLLAGLFWLLLAAARPQWGASEVTVTQRGSDVVVALDISNSMLAEDVAPNRIGRAKAELDAFLDRLQDSRLGLVFFAGSAFVQCPLTLDYGTARIFLDMAGPDMLSQQGTAIAAALETSHKLLTRGQGGQEPGFQAILLVTDGEDLEGDWEDAARSCLDDGIRIIPVGVGSVDGGLIPVTDDQGQPAGFMKDSDGKVVMSRLDMESLQKLADMGGGSAFRIGLDGLAGDRLFMELERLGKRELEDRRIAAFQERYQWPLLLALVCLALRLALETEFRPRAPRSAAAVLLLFLAAGPARAGIVKPEVEAMNRGRTAYLEGDYKQALSDFGAALVQSPDDPLISLALGETLNRLQKYDDAAREFQRTLELTDDPSLRAEALYNAGTTLLANQKPREAAAKLRDSLALDPDQPDALVNLERALEILRRQQQDQQQQDKPQQKEKQDDQKEQEKQEKQPSRNRQDEQQDQDQQQQQQDQQQKQQQQQQQQQPQQKPEQGQQDQQKPADRDQSQGQKPLPSGAEGDEPEDGKQLDREHALQVLKALDQDEQELKRSVQKRLQGGKPRSGKRW